MALSEWRSPRCWAALGVLVLGWFVIPRLDALIYQPLAHVLDLHMIQHGEMMLVPYSWLMVVRLVANSVLFVAVCVTLGSGPMSFPLIDVRLGKHFAAGLIVGVAVMVAAILAVVLIKAADIEPSMQPI